MANFIVLDRNTHKNTRVITGRGEKYGESIHSVPVIAEELHQLVLEYPVCLIKDNDTGQFGLNALLGFEAGENLFLNEEKWNASYIPLHIRRQPFMVAVNDKAGAKPTKENTAITINMDNTRVQEKEGELLFDKEGNTTPYMNEINNLLASLVKGIMQTEVFINTLLEYELIEAVQLTVTLNNGEEKRFDGVYTIHEDNFQALSSDVLASFHTSGYLQACYMLKMSVGNIQKMIVLKNKNN